MLTLKHNLGPWWPQVVDRIDRNNRLIESLAGDCLRGIDLENWWPQLGRIHRDIRLIESRAADYLRGIECLVQPALLKAQKQAEIALRPSLAILRNLDALNATWRNGLDFLGIAFDSQSLNSAPDKCLLPDQAGDRYTADERSVSPANEERGFEPNEPKSIRCDDSPSLAAKPIDLGVELDRYSVIDHYYLLSHSNSDRSPEKPAGESSVNLFKKEGKVWCLRFDGKTTIIPQSRGVERIGQLIFHKYHSICVLELRNITGKAPISRYRDVAIDAKAREEYRQSLGCIKAEIEKAKKRGDLAIIQQLEEERSQIIRELRANTGLDGRNRADSDLERARKAVGNSIRNAIEIIRFSHPILARHLDLFLQTGYFCSYSPAPDIEWN